MSPDVRRPIDRVLLLFALMLMSIGMVWVYSASAFKSSQVSTAFLVKQLLGGGLGIILMLGLSQMPIATLRERPRPLMVAYGGVILLLVAVFFFPKINGAQRWLILRGYQFQPSELMKPLAVLIVSWWMVKHASAWLRKEDAVPKLVTLAGILVLPLGLILKEPDFGTTTLILLVSMLLVYLGGAPKWIFAISIPAVLAAGTAFVFSAKYRMERVTSFLDPGADPLGHGHQALQSLIALGNGGLTGTGLGGSMQKLHYLPEAHTDFIFAVIGEEAGILGTTAVLLLYLGILWRGYRVARRVKDSFLRLAATGLTFTLVVQALFNMSVVLSLAPNKGIPLPFVSYGASSLIVALMTLGLLLAISKEAATEA